jgi:hypothetical protein
VTKSKDPRVQHLRAIHRRLAGARKWSVTAAAVTGSALVALPYAGIGAPDIAWAGAAGGSLAVAVWRWRDYRALAAQPVPASLPAGPALSLGQRMAPLVRVAPMFGPVLGPLIDRPRRIVVPSSSPAADAARRLNAAAAVLPQLLTRLGEHAGDLGAESDAALQALRDLAARLSLVERSLRVVAPDARDTVLAARGVLVARFDEGVTAYERLASAAAECVAALSRGGEEAALSRGGDGTAAARLTEAAEALAGLAHGLTTVHETNRARGVA